MKGCGRVLWLGCGAVFGSAAAVYTVMALRGCEQRSVLTVSLASLLWPLVLAARSGSPRHQSAGPPRSVRPTLWLSLVVTTFAGWRVAEALDHRSRPPGRLSDYETADWAPLGVGWILPYDVPVDVSGYHLSLMAADGTGRRRLSGPWPEPGPISWSPDGGRILFATTRGKREQGLYVVAPDLARERLFQATDEPVAWLGWSQDGKLARYGDQDREFVSRGDGAEPLTGADARRAFWPEGRTEVIADSDGTIQLVDRDGQPTRGPAATYADPAWSPDGRMVAVTRRMNSGTDIELLPVAGGPGRRVGDGRLPVFSPDGTRLAFVRRHEAIAQRQQTPQGLREWSVGGDLHVLDLRSGTDRRLTWRLKHVDDIHWLPDGRRIVFWGQGRKLRGEDGRRVQYWGEPEPAAGWALADEAALLADTADGTLRRLADAQAVWCSPDGRRALLVEAIAGPVKPPRMLALDLATGASRPFTDVPPDELVAAAWSPDGNYVALARRSSSKLSTYRPSARPEREFWLADADGGNLRRLGGRPAYRRRVAGYPYRRAPVRWTPDGKALVYLADGDAEGSLRRLDVTTGAETVVQAEGCRAYAMAPVGRNLALVTRADLERNVRLVGWDGRTIRELVQEELPRGRSPKLSPDGRRVAFISLAEAGARLRVTNTDGSDPGDLPGPITDCRDLAWSPDGTLLAFIRGPEKNEEVGVVPAAGGRPTILSPSPGRYRELLWSADSRKLAFLSFGRAPGGTVVAEVTGRTVTGPVSYYRPTWFPDGQRLLLQRFGPSDLDARGLPVYGEIATMRWNGADLRLLSSVPPPWLEPPPAFHDGPSDGGAELSPDGRWIAYWHQGPSTALGWPTMPLCVLVFCFLGPLCLVWAWSAPVEPSGLRRLARLLTTVVMLLFLASVTVAALAQLAAGLSAMM